MRIIPLTRKVREIARGREVLHKRTHDPTRWLMVIVVFLITVFLTTQPRWAEQVPTEQGNIIQEPIISQFAFTYQPGQTESWKRKREQTSPRIFEYNSNIKAAAVDRVERILSRADDIEVSRLENNIESVKEELAILDPQLQVWENDEIAALVRLAQDERFRDAATHVIEEIYSGYFVTTDYDWTVYTGEDETARIESFHLPPEQNPQRRILGEETDIDLRNLIKRQMEPSIRKVLSEEQKGEASLFSTSPGEAAFQLLTLGVRPNFEYNERKTELAYDNFPADPPIHIAKGAILAPWKDGAAESSGALRNQRWPYRLKEFEAGLLSSYSRQLSRVNLMQFGAQVLFVLITFLIISFFVIKFSRELAFNTQTVLLLSLPVLLALGLGRVFLILTDGSPFAGYAFPAGVIGILSVLLLDVRLAILLVTWGCVLFGLEANLRYEFVIVGLLGGYTGVAALFTFRERREVLYAGLLIGIVNGSTILILDYISGQSHDVWTAAAIGALSGVLSSLISFAVLPVFEVAFHITTDMRLLELSGLQHPILREMEERAPGTLQHTMNVAKLAESAATAIGVNYLLVRAGVYFHDIGKISKPEYFTENQLTAEDKKRHEALSPNMSTLIIRNHVKEGIELAKKYKLPKVVVDFIPEHHGTSLITYFHMKAKQAFENGDIKEPVREDDFRYPGPRPQTIESAIVMLADTVEATATAKLSSRAVREDDIQMLVRNAITEKFNDGQFDDCNLTLRDLNTIRESFVKTLRSRFHARIDYPAAKKTEAKPEPKPEDKDQAPEQKERVSREIATGAGK